MKKKLLPFILGCAMVATMPLTAHAALSDNTTVEYANEIPTGQTSPTDGDESLNGFTEYNDVTTTENTVDKVFGSGATALGNTRNTTATMQDGYPITLQNEKQDYRAGDTPTTLANDIDDANTNFADQTNDTAGTTDLETSVPEFDMKIPASTVLPLGATRWRIGNVEINGRYFVRPDKVKVVLTKQNFHNDQTYDTTKQESDSANTGKWIAFDVTDKRYTSTSVVSADKYYFQDGKHTGTNHDTDTKQTNFPYAYTGYSSDRYEDGLVSEINETHQVWVLTTDWANKDHGAYTGSITFNAEVTTDDTETDANMYINYYPGEGHETQP